MKALPTTKKRLINLACIAAVLFLCVAGMRSFGKRMWEEMLYGPYPGRPHVGALPTSPSSTIDVARVRLAIFELPGNSNPVLVCYSATGEVLSQTLLIPERTNSQGVVRTAFVKKLRFQESYSPVSKKFDGPVVKIDCVWEWGGIEAGLLSLHSDGRFKEMWLSW